MTKPRISVSLRLSAALALLATLAPVARAQERPPLVEQVRVGLPARTGDPDYGLLRRSAWAPIYVKIKAGTAAIPHDALRLVAETTDTEGATYTYSTPLPAAEPEADLFAVTYVRPGNTDVLITLQTADGKSVPFQIRSGDGRAVAANRITRDFRNQLETSHTLYLAVGSKLPGLSRELAKMAANVPGIEEAPPEERSLRKLAAVDNVRDLPDRWFGYDAVDVVVLSTSSDSFVKDLLDPNAAPRRRALGEWVRRGGKLVVAAGRNRQLVAELLDQMPLSEFDKQPLIACKIEGVSPRKSLPVLTRWCTTGKEQPPTLEGVELTVLGPNARPDEGPGSEQVTTLVREAPEGAEQAGAPVVVHAACGLGRVVLVGFDVETPPFFNWKGQRAFWEKVEEELDPLAASGRSKNVQINQFNQFGNMPGLPESGELAVDLKRGLESFQEVPVISFGWVALFILVYIIIVGPLDYLILKKVFKRLELTWITFPTVVIAISVAAYFTAYSLKGDDLRINKFDVIDFDLHGPAPQAYGATWVTLFSPRIQNYTIGVEPAAPKWADAPAADVRATRPVVSVMDGVDPTERVGSQTIFRRPYTYAHDASGLEGVSIPVWSMRTFTGRWRAGITPGQAPVDAELRHSRDKNDPALLGRVVNRLPVELHDVTLVYKGRAYAVGTVPPGGFSAVDNLKVGEQGKQVNQWLSENAGLTARGGRTVTSPYLIRDLLFHGPPASPQGGKGNSGWHSLDQSWRLRSLTEVSWKQPRSVYRDEVLLVGRVASQTGGSESITSADASPTRLWLGALPGSGSRPSLSGYIVQDVYVRAFIPVIP